MYDHRPLYPVPWWQQGCLTPCNKYPQPPSFFPCAGEEFVIRFLGVDCDGNAIFCLKRKPQHGCGPCPRNK